MRKLIITVVAVSITLVACGAPQVGDALPLEEVRVQSVPLPPAPQEHEPQPTPATLTLSVAEGYTIARIGMAIEELGASTTTEFIGAAQTGDFSEFSLVAAMPRNPERFFALEGYLFPGVYEIYPDQSSESIIRHMLSQTEQMIDEDLRRSIAESGRTVDEILTLASIVQSESLGNDDAKPLVSSVIHNRIATGMMLQMCKTSFYVRDYIAPLYEGDPARFHEQYNTYMLHGLPAGPICNPGPSAIRAALAPARTNYFFYIWDDYDNFHFAATWEEHLANVQKYLR